MRGGRGSALIAGLVLLGTVLSGCSADTSAEPGPTTPAAPTSTAPTSTAPDAATTPAPSGGDDLLLAVPPEGVAPSTVLDVGGPDLEQRCADNELPIPVDVVLIGCGAGAGRSTSLGVSFDPGTYWVVLVCSGAGELTIETEQPGLASETTVACSQDGRAVREELGTTTAAAVGDVVTAGSGDETTIAFWLVREGKTTL